MPRWFRDQRRQRIGEWLALDFWIDDCLGVEFEAGRWPYSEYKREGFEAFGEMVGAWVVPELA